MPHIDKVTILDSLIDANLPCLKMYCENDKNCRVKNLTIFTEKKGRDKVWP